MCEVLTGVRYHDAMSSTLFTVALNMAPQRTAEKGNITYKSKQICAHAGDIVLVTRNIRWGGGTTPCIGNSRQKNRLRINAEETKYMKMSPTEVQ